LEAGSLPAQAREVDSPASRNSAVVAAQRGSVDSPATIVYGLPQKEVTFLPQVENPNTRIYRRADWIIKDTRRDVSADTISFRQRAEGSPPILSPDVDTVALLTSELTTNAVMHGTGDSFLVHTGWTKDGHFFLAVASDGEYSPKTGSEHRGRAKDEGGRGLKLVKKLSHAFSHKTNVQIGKVWDNAFVTEFKSGESDEADLAAFYSQSFDLSGLAEITTTPSTK